MAETAETPEIRLRRLKMRSWRRGMKEMDLILGHYADGPLASLPAADLDAYEVVLEENDQDLYRWITASINGGADTGPAALQGILGQVADHAAARLRPAE